MTKLLGIRTVYDIDPTKTFLVADILESGAILPHSVTLDKLMVADLEPADEPEKPQCACYEFIGDNPDCPVHGDYFKKADDQERQDLYTLGMGA